MSVESRIGFNGAGNPKKRPEHKLSNRGTISNKGIRESLVLQGLPETTARKNGQVRTPGFNASARGVNAGESASSGDARSIVSSTVQILWKSKKKMPEGEWPSGEEVECLNER